MGIIFVIFILIWYLCFFKNIRYCLVFKTTKVYKIVPSCYRKDYYRVKVWRLLFPIWIEASCINSLSFCQDYVDKMRKTNRV